MSSPFGGFWLWFAGAAVAGLTAFYTFRLIFMTFHGRSRVSQEVARHIHESPKIMTIPLGVLAVLAIVGGYIGIPHIFNKFEHFLEPVFTQYVHREIFESTHDLPGLELSFMGISILIAFLGIGFAYIFYVARPNLADDVAETARGIYRVFANKWYVDEVYDTYIVRPVKLVSDLVLWRWIDIKVIDGFVNQIARVLGKSSDILRRIETGVIQNYALSIIFGVVVLVGYFLWR